MMFKRKRDWLFIGKKDDLNFFSASCDGRDISHRSFATKENLQLNSRSSRRQNKLVPPDVQENPGLLISQWPLYLVETLELHRIHPSFHHLHQLDDLRQHLHFQRYLLQV